MPVVTPDAIGYWKLSLCAMICWRGAELRKATNLCASSWCDEDFRMPAPETSTTYPNVVGSEVRKGGVHVRCADFGPLSCNEQNRLTMPMAT